MLVFELTINGKKIARGGRDDLSVLSSCITAVGVLGRKSKGPGKLGGETDIHVHLGGLTGKKDSAKDVHLDWTQHTPLKVGDEVKIKIIEAAKADKPAGKPRPANRVAKEKSAREMYQRAKKFYMENRARYEPDAV